MARRTWRHGDPLYIIDAQMRAASHRHSAKESLIPATAAYHEEVARRYDHIVEEYDTRECRTGEQGKE